MVDCVCFPPSLQVFPSQDPLDRADFNAVEYINALFPTEQVSNAPNTLSHTFFLSDFTSTLYYLGNLIVKIPKAVFKPVPKPFLLNTSTGNKAITIITS